MTAQERRQHPRAWWPFAIKYRAAAQAPAAAGLQPGQAGGPWRSGSTVNLSSAGVRFTCMEPLTPGSRVVFELVIEPKQGPYVVEGGIIWGRTVDQKVYEYGAAFVDATPEQQRQITDLVEFLNREPLRLPESDEAR
ncbi:MAG: PilZ domain-containing protein [Candidatus Omnitrophica bacterium]|nr:PilZ domain-containing protein [Candidatus Omnitrophota bacterium]